MTSSTRYAGFWIRFVANLIDWIVLNLAAAALEGAVFGTIFAVRRLAGDSAGFFEAFPPVLLQAGNVIAYLGVGIPYYVGLQVRLGGTWGKRALGIRVVQAGTLAPITGRQAWVRCVAYGAAYLPVGCGFLMAAFHPQKRALHDLIAGTVSIRDR